MENSSICLEKLIRNRAVKVGFLFRLLLLIFLDKIDASPTTEWMTRSGPHFVSMAELIELTGAILKSRFCEVEEGTGRRTWRASPIVSMSLIATSRQEVLCTCFSGCPDTMSFMDLLRHMHTLLCPPTRLIYSPGVRSSHWMRLPGNKSSTENTLGPVLKDLPFGLSTRKETVQLNTRLRATCSFFFKLIHFIF